MSKTSVDARQIIIKRFLSQIADRSNFDGTADAKQADATEIDILLDSIDLDLTSPLRIDASNPIDLTISIGASLIPNTKTNRNNAIGHIDNTLVNFTSGTIVFPASSGNPVVVTPGSNPTLTVTNNNFIKGIIHLTSAGNLGIVFGTENVVEASATVPKAPQLTMPIGYVTLFNNAGTIDNVSQDKIFQLSALQEMPLIGDLGATDNVLSRTDGVTGQKVQGSAVTLDDSDNIGNITSLGVGVTTGAKEATAIAQFNSTTQGILPVKMTEAQRDNISSPATALEIWNTDANTKQVFNGTSWVSIGGGGGGSLNFYINGDAESASLSDFVTGNDPIFDNGGSIDGIFSISTTAADLIRGDKSFKYITGTSPNSVDDFIASEVIDIPPGYRGRFLGIKFQYRWSGPDDDLVWVVKRTTATAKILTDGIDFIKTQDNAADTAREFFLSFFCPDDCEQVEIGPQVIAQSTTGETFIWDDVILTPDPFVFKDLDTENVFSAKLDSSTDVVSDENTPFVDSTTNIGTGNGTVTYNSGFFSVTPNVVASAQASNIFVRIENASATGFDYRLRNDAGATVDGAFTFMVQKQGVDYEETVETVVHHPAGVENVFSALIQNNGSASILSQSSPDNPAIASVNRVSAGRIEIFFTTNFFSAPPIVVGMPGSTVSIDTVKRDAVTTTTSCIIVTLSHASAATDSDFEIIIQRQEDDYKLPTAFAITPLLRTVILEDQKAGGTTGGNFVLGAWRTRDLNTVRGDASVASLDSNQFTLQPGSYLIDATAPGFRVAAHQTRLRNITDSTDDIIGTAEFTNNTSPVFVNTRSIIKGKLTLLKTTTFEIQHRCTTTDVDGFGNTITVGVNSLYTQVEITKLK